MPSREPLPHAERCDIMLCCAVSQNRQKDSIRGNGMLFVVRSCKARDLLVWAHTVEITLAEWHFFPESGDREPVPLTDQAATHM